MKRFYWFWLAETWRKYNLGWLRCTSLIDTVSLILNVLELNSGSEAQALHLIHSAYIYLTINKGQFSDFKGAHGIQQWWILILPVKLSIYVLSVQPALNEAAKSVNRPKRLPNTAAQVCGRMSLGKAFVWPKLGKSCITTQSILILFFLWSILCLLEIEGRIQINMFWTT